jgi:glutamate/tyrosine decarboxylase-like PLP-dependent enzyme
VDQARYLAALVRRDHRLELLAPVHLNIVCFRYRAAGLPEQVLNELNRRILIAVQERGIAVPSHVLIGDRFALRCAITNHRSCSSDFEALVAGVARVGDELSGDLAR